MRFKHIKSRALHALPVLSLILLAFAASAQEKTSLVKGVVQNNSNQPIAGVSVVIRNTANNFTSGTTSDTTGGFNFSRIPSGGPYSFTFTMIGYENQTLSGYYIK